MAIPYIGYHGSPSLFHQFEAEHLMSKSGAENALLGFFVTPSAALALKFGIWIYRVEVTPRLVEEIPLEILHQLHNSASIGAFDFSVFREELVAREVDMLRVIEHDGRCDMVIVTNPGVMRIQAIENPPPQFVKMS